VLGGCLAWLNIVLSMPVGIRLRKNVTIKHSVSQEGPGRY